MGIKKYGRVGKLREMNLSLIKKNIVMEKSELFSVIIITFIKYLIRHLNRSFIKLCPVEIRVFKDKNVKISQSTVNIT